MVGDGAGGIGVVTTGDGGIADGIGHIGGGIHIITIGQLIMATHGKEYILILGRPRCVEAHQAQVTL
tara:strand:+ start:89 stop:289 length:201 start_codon:yes stop_codon:yes gene_type:complete